MKKTSAVLALALAAATAANGGDVTLTWSSAATPATLGDDATGKLEFGYSGGVLSSVKAYPVGGGTITLAGDPVSCTAGTAVLMCAQGGLVFESTVTSAGSLHVGNAGPASEKEIAYDGVALEMDSDTTVFEGKELSEWDVWMTRGTRGYGPTANRYAYVSKRTADTLEAQLQTHTSDSGKYYFVSVKTLFRQQGDDIVARIVMAPRWASSTYCDMLGKDMDLLLADVNAYAPGYEVQWLNENNGVVTDTSESGAGYSVSKIWMRRVKGLPTVRFKGGLKTTGNNRLVVNNYVRGIVDGCSTGDIWGFDVTMMGVLTLRNPVNGFLVVPSSGSGGGVTGCGRIEFEATDEPSYSNPYNRTYPGWMPTNWVTVAHGADLSALTNATARFGGHSMAAAWRNMVGPIQRLSVAADGQTATGQFHYIFGGWYGIATTNRCAALIVEFRQNGGDVQMRTVKATCYGGNDTSATDAIAAYGTDLSAVGGAVKEFKIATSDTDDTTNYGIHDIALNPPTAQRVTTVYRYPAFSNFTNAVAVGKKAIIVLRGTDATAMRLDAQTQNAFPSGGGIVEMENGGELALNLRTATATETSADYRADTAKIHICEGGRLLNQYKHGLGVTQEVYVAGGVFDPFSQATSSWSGPVNTNDVANGYCHVNRLRLEDGARVQTLVTNDAPFVRAGYSVDSVWTASGTSPSYCGLGLCLWSDGATRTNTFCVLDGAELVMDGRFFVDEGHPDVAVRKTGDGTLTLNGAVELRGRPVAVEGGTVKFGASVCAGEASAYSVNGGGIAAAASTTNSVGPLAVGPEGASIEIGEGTVLEFADSSGQAWSGDVTVTGFAEKSIRFGTNANGLTKAQRARIGIGTGEDVYISAKGWLTLTPPGMFIAIQ